MTTKRKSFSYSWGSGYVAEEARVEGEYHVPTLQLLKYTEGDAAGNVLGPAAYALQSPAICNSAVTPTPRR